MLIYFIVFILSLSGISVVAIRHKDQIAEFYFAAFMESLISNFKEWWFSEAHSYFLKLLEKYLRKSRIFVLKIESFLFRKVHAVRGISERNKNGNGTHNEENLPE